ncbi:recombinase family protein [uncultured Oscillibacter sp.]|uniref:recombinase family protein n=1 Tax=uncultured Oscillibacter sp. TaxID=876091 RepID=UPI0025F17CFB|nr:recombinase family protein [uncultured Oscillibacter sp.]
MSDLIEKSKETGLDVMPSFDFVFEKETEQQTQLAEHRAWLKSIKHERPLPKRHFKVAVYIRYLNQTKYDNYLAFHKQQFTDTLGLCPNWEFVGFYVDEGGTAPNMETAEAWSKLLQDCYDGKVDLIITQKASNVSKKLYEISFCSRILAALKKPVGIYFISEDIYTLASYYQDDLKDPSFLPAPDWQVLPDDNAGVRGMLHD